VAEVRQPRGRGDTAALLLVIVGLIVVALVWAHLFGLV
jgi:hypothetical protein